jgi:hypothetical protein
MARPDMEGVDGGVAPEFGGRSDAARRAETRGKAGDVDVVLDRDRDAEQRKLFPGCAFTVGDGSSTLPASPSPIHLMNHRGHIYMASGDLKTVGRVSTTSTAELSAHCCVAKYIAAHGNNEFAVV